MRVFPAQAATVRLLTLSLCGALINQGSTGRRNLLCIALLFLFVPPCTYAEGDSATVYRTASGFGFRVEVIAQKLEIPWALAFAPDGRLFVTERPGRLRVIENGQLKSEPVATLPDVLHLDGGEGGLMAVALDPQFATNHFLYLSYTTRSDGAIINRVVRYREAKGALSERTIILDNIPGAQVHDGCRVAFGPDGKLYVTTGDATERQLAQQLDSLAGKILRLNSDGTTPADNPFPGSPVYTLGHRNAQGLAWHPTTKIAFSTEHGPSGFDGPGGGDEFNLIRAGENYGWPVIHHGQTHAGMEAHLLSFTPAIAPASGTFYSGTRLSEFTNNFFFGAVRGQHLHRVVLAPPDFTAVQSHEALLQGTFGRIREVVTGPDGALYFTTSNRDGRAQPGPKDDQVLRIVPEK
ncbi:MAG: PQQ-dependent sugar dehydrogenase [Deltaproteobacteria bacterium]|nr:PQQ-dependent sugar dehydrogenase [Deltaproteobacteria bacterium]